MTKDSKNKEIETGKGKIKVKNKDKSKEFEIEITQNKIEIEKDKKEATVKIDAKIKVFELTDGKRKDDDKGKDETGKKLEAEYKKGTFISSLKLKKVDTFEIDGTKNIKSYYHWPFWTSIVVGVLAIVGLIAWWVMSNRKGEKEEGDL